MIPWIAANGGLALKSLRRFSASTFSRRNGNIRAFHCGLRVAGILLALSALSRADVMGYMGAISGHFGTIDLSTGAFTFRANSGVTLAGLAVANGITRQQVTGTA
jgi:hypothetical protein